MDRYFSAFTVILLAVNAFILMIIRSDVTRQAGKAPKGL
jgi:hypothetical protein